MRGWVAISILACACGARSGLDVPEQPDAQAAPDAPIQPDVHDFKVAYVGEQGLAVWRSKDQSTLSFGETFYDDPALTLDGKLLVAASVLQSPPNPEQVVFFDPAGQVVRAQTFPTRNPAPRPDGQRIAYADYESCFTTGDADGTVHQPPCIATSHPLYGPDGITVVFTEGSIYLDQRIATMHDDGTHHEVLLAEDPNGYFYAEPSFSFDGKQVVFLRRQGGGPAEIDVLDTSTLAVHLITKDGGARRSPHFTPDGEAILFATRRGTRRAVGSVNVKNGVVTTLLPDIGPVSLSDDPPISVAPAAP